MFEYTWMLCRVARSPPVYRRVGVPDVACGPGAATNSAIRFEVCLNKLRSLAAVEFTLRGELIKETWQ